LGTGILCKRQTVKLASRAAARSLCGSASQAFKRSAIASTAPVSTGNEVSPPTPGGNAAASSRETSRMPECPADTGSTPQAAASAATIPKASGNVLGITSASAPGSSSATSSCSSRPMNSTDSPIPRAASRYRSGGSAKNSLRIDSDPSSPPSSARPSRATARASSKSPLSSAASKRFNPCSYSPNPAIRSLASGCSALTRGHAASRRSNPLETISLPTKTILRGSCRRVGGPSLPLPFSPGAPPLSSSGLCEKETAAVGRDPPPDATRGRNVPVSTPGGPRRVFSRRPRTLGKAAHRDSAVWRDPTSTQFAASMPSSAYGRKRCGWGLTVYSRAEPWILAAKDPMPARARMQGPMTRCPASAASGGPAESTTARTASTLASM
jgi:hypothetical protein